MTERGTTADRAAQDAGTSGAVVLGFDAIGDDMLAAVGGKAANLGRLHRADLPVPPGFCVTTAAYRLAAGAVLGPILDDLAGGPAPDQAAVAALAERARAALVAAPMPAAVAAAVTEAYQAMGDEEPVAVRSSATAEDLPFASFAGQQDTYLNVVGVDAVLAAVHRCWASLWNDRAVSYRATNGIDHREVRLAVIVQLMVDAAVAGVMFTANPVTGKRGETVIDASPGLGEAVVSGAVNPDHFVVDTTTGEVVERRLGDKRLVITATAGGGTTRATRDEGDQEYCLTDEQIRALVALGQRVTAQYGTPQDTEWAIDGAGRLWLTQARPITTLFPIPDAASGQAGDLRVYFCFSLAQGLYRPITPMGLSTIRVIGTSASRLAGVPVADPVAGPPVIGAAAGRLFIDITAVVRSSLGRRLAPRVLDFMEARSAVILRGLFDDPRLAIVDGSRWPVLRRAVRVAARYRVPLVVGQAVLRPQVAWRRLAAVEADIRRQTTLPDGATAADRLDFVIATAGETIVPLLPRILPVAGVGFAMLGLAGRLLGDAAKPGELPEVLRSLPHNVTTEMDLDLWRLATAVRADADAAGLVLDTPVDELVVAHRAGALPPVLQNGLSAFLDRYGHRAVAEIDIGMPRWSEDPAHVLGVLANYLRLSDQERASDVVFARGATQAEALVADLTARARRRGRLRGRLVGLALRRAREFAGVRELPKYYLVLVLARLRAQLAAVGAELAAAGRIATPDDVFFLDLREAQVAVDGQDMHEVVAGRRAEYAQELRRRHLPRLLLSDGTEPEAPTSSTVDTTDAMTGSPASAGTVTGPARVILDPVGAHLEPGEILVAPSTDPGWTPLFLTAGGLVMEMGGPNSHGAVVAREYGIPAVVGVPGATTRIVTGQQITVDGTNGQVT
jgi:phosphohistidine swiveling domain-containing protein